MSERVCYLAVSIALLVEATAFRACHCLNWWVWLVRSDEYYVSVNE